MAAPRYLSSILGKLKQVIAAVVSTPDSIVSTDATGKIDISFLPPGVGAEVIIAITSENLVAGNFINVYLNGGVITLRKADATTNAKPAYGYVIAGSTSPASTTMYILGTTNSYLSGLTIGTRYFLDTVAGGVTLTAPSATGNIVQELGIATLTTELLTLNSESSTVEIA